MRGRIEYAGVTFRYKSGDAPALRDVNATIEAGEIVALVGPSGAGKTTIVNLVPRFYAPQEGRVLIDGIDIAGARLSDLRAAVAIVPQDVQLFRGSILDNIRYGRIDATDEQVRTAARDANVDEFVRAFADGYATEVGERGVRLSGGERQRIAIARAVLRDPRILILDEATSALDSHSEAMIEEALDRLLPGRTTLIIAHRLSTARRANKVFFVEGGCVVEIGTHDELLAKGGAYARLHAAQFRQNLRCGPACKLALVQREAVPLWIACKSRNAARKLVDLADLDARRGQPLAHRLEIVDFERRAVGSARLEAEPLAVADAERGAANIEFDPVIAERIARRQPQRLAVKGARARHVAYGIGEKGDIFDHQATLRASPIACGGGQSLPREKGTLSSATASQGGHHART